jgi:hypothetical protein
MIRAGKAVWSFQRRVTGVGGPTPVGPDLPMHSASRRITLEHRPTASSMQCERHLIIRLVWRATSAPHRQTDDVQSGCVRCTATCTLGVISGRCVVYTRAGSPSQKSPPSEKANLHEMDRYLASCHKPRPQPVVVARPLSTRGGSQSRGRDRMQRMRGGIYSDGGMHAHRISLAAHHHERCRLGLQEAVSVLVNAGDPQLQQNVVELRR